MELRYKIVFWGKGASKLTYRGKKGGKIEVIEDWKSECVNNLVADCRSGRKPNYEKRNRKLVGFGNGISCGWEQKSTAERFSIGRPQARKKAITEDSMNWNSCVQLDISQVRVANESDIEMNTRIGLSRLCSAIFEHILVFGATFCSSYNL